MARPCQRIRGSSNDISLLSLTEEEKMALLAVYEDDKYAISGRHSRDGRLETWARLTRLWFGEAVELVPVEVAHIAAVGAVMKRYGYRSFAQYVTVAR